MSSSGLPGSDRWPIPAGVNCANLTPPAPTWGGGVRSCSASLSLLTETYYGVVNCDAVASRFAFVQPLSL